MDFSAFKDTKKNFVVTMFIDNDTLQRKQKELEAFSNQRNIKLVVQPCPYEGIEFLYRISDELKGHFRSLEKDIFWEAIEVKTETSKDMMGKIADIHHQFLVAILEQDTAKVKSYASKLTTFSDFFLRPLA